MLYYLMKINGKKLCSNAYFGVFRGGGHLESDPIIVSVYLKVKQGKHSGNLRSLL